MSLQGYSTTHNVMYLGEPSLDLSVGDVLHLPVESLTEVLQYPESLRPLWESFSRNARKCDLLFAIISRSCLLTEADGRFCERQIAVLPLNSFLAELRSGSFSGLNISHTNYRNIVDKGRDAICTSLEKTVTEQLPKINKEDINTLIEPMTKQVRELAKKLRSPVVADPIKCLMSAVRDRFYPSDILRKLVDLALLDPELSKMASESYETGLQTAPKVKWPKAGRIQELESLFNNQEDDSFVFQPCATFACFSDISYVARFCEVFSLILKHEMVNAKLVSKVLGSRRVVSLKEEYAHRLQNLFSCYYGKIGTADISAQPVLDLYLKQNKIEKA